MRTGIVLQSEELLLPPVSDRYFCELVEKRQAHCSAQSARSASNQHGFTFKSSRHSVPRKRSHSTDTENTFIILQLSSPMFRLLRHFATAPVANRAASGDTRDCCTTAKSRPEHLPRSKS